VGSQRAPPKRWVIERDHVKVRLSVAPSYTIYLESRLERTEALLRKVAHHVQEAMARADLLEASPRYRLLP
jgi:hypothetical protein